MQIHRDNHPHAHTSQLPRGAPGGVLTFWLIFKAGTASPSDEAEPEARELQCPRAIVV